MQQLNPERSTMADTIVPCYGGPRDGRFYANNASPPGYRTLTVRGKLVFVWNAMKVERIDFSILHKAAKSMPSSFDDIKEEEKDDSEDAV